MSEYYGSDVDEGYEPDKEEASAEKNMPKWSQEDPADYISITSISLGSTDETQCDDEDNAVLVVPKCAPPAEGWPGLVIVPGKSGAKERHTIWSEMLAGRGIATMNIDMCPSNKADMGPDVMRAVNWMKAQAPGGEADAFMINPNDITVMGYSAGGKYICNFVFTDMAHEVKNIISVAGINKAAYGYLPDDKSIFENENFPNFLAIQALDDSMMTGNYIEDFVDGFTGSAASKAHAAIYFWGGHQPNMQTDFFYLIDSFIKDPAGFQQPRAYDSDWTTWKSKNTHYGSNYVKYEDKSTKDDDGKALSCWDNEDEHDDFLRALDANFWSGNSGLWSCRGLCSQIYDCGYLELFDAKVKTAEGDQINCILYKKKCSSPTYSYDGEIDMLAAAEIYTGDHTLSTCNPASPAYTGPEV